MLRNALTTPDAAFDTIDHRIERLLQKFELVMAGGQDPDLATNFTRLQRAFRQIGVISDEDEDDDDDEDSEKDGPASDGGGSDGGSADGADLAGRRQRRRCRAPPAPPPQQQLSLLLLGGAPAGADDSVDPVQGLRAGGLSQGPTVVGDVWPPRPALLAGERFCKPLCAPGWAGAPTTACAHCSNLPGCIVDGGDVAVFLDAELKKASDTAATFASNGFRSLDREANNIQRKRCYRVAAIQHLHYSFREPLPECLVCRVRAIWPAASGVYMGYKGW